MTICDHTSVGILVFREGRLLLIERKKPPFGLAAPAGHVDSHGDSMADEESRFAAAARAELEEETGLKATSLIPIAEGRKENPCRREGGTWHFWRLYEAGTEGELDLSQDETKGHVWAGQDQMRHLLNRGTLPTENGEIGLEPIWREWFAGINILSRFSN